MPTARSDPGRFLIRRSCAGARQRPWTMAIPARSQCRVQACPDDGFIGDMEPGIEPASDDTAELRHKQWVVTDNDDRTRREIRALADRVTKRLKAHQDLYAGKRPVKNA